MLDVYYPGTKRRFQIVEGYMVGVSVLPQLGLCPLLFLGSDVVILDPRSIIVEAGDVCYSPRNYPFDDFDPDMRRWLSEHPSWGVPGCEVSWGVDDWPLMDSPGVKR